MPPDFSEQSKSRLFSLQDGTLRVAQDEVGEISMAQRAIGSIVDSKFKITGFLGQGGMGAVYRAHHLMLLKDVALKTFVSSALTDDARLRFQREAQSIARLDNSNIVKIYDFGVAEDQVPYYTMEILEGESLADRLKRGKPLAPVEALKLFVPVCQALALAHQKGIIHRDLKPANIFLIKGENQDTWSGVKILDFGIASLSDQSFASSKGFASNQGPLDLDGGLSRPSNQAQQRLTSIGVIFGSPLYMSPEQTMGLPTTLKSDIYSLGCSIFEALVGAPPFLGDTAIETMLLQQTEPAESLSSMTGRRFAPELERVVAKMLEKDPARRQTSMTQVAAELTAAMDACKRVESEIGSAPRNVNSPGRNKRENKSENTSETFSSHDTPKSSIAPAVLASMAMVLLVIAGAGGYWLWQRAQTNSTADGTDRNGNVSAEADNSIKSGANETAINGANSGANSSVSSGAITDAGRGANSGVNSGAIALLQPKGKDYIGSKSPAAGQLFMPDINEFTERVLNRGDQTYANASPSFDPNKKFPSSIAPICSYATIKRGKESWHSLHFPPELPFGKFQVGAGRLQDADKNGNFCWPVSQFLCFYPSTEFLQRPENLQVIPQNALCSIGINPLPKNPALVSKVLANLDKQPYLNYLALSGGKLSDADIATFDRFKYVGALCINETQANCEAVSKLKAFKAYNTINVSGNNNVTPLLEAAVNCKNLQTLAISNIELTERDYKALSKLKKLKALDVNDTGISDKTLALLGDLPELEVLRARGASITRKSLPIFRKLAKMHLKEVLLSDAGWTPYDINALRQIVPRTYIKEELLSLTRREPGLAKELLGDN